MESACQQAVLSVIEPSSLMLPTGTELAAGAKRFVETSCIGVSKHMCQRPVAVCQVVCLQGCQDLVI